jgi:hypothetical protein
MKKSFLLGVFVFAAMGMTAWSDIVLDQPSVSGSGTAFTWDYSAFLGPNQTIVPNQSFFTIYDVGNFNAGSVVTPAGWTFSSLTVGPNPVGASVLDDPNIANITWKYTGATNIVGPATNGTPIPLGIFGFVTSTNQTRDGEFAAQAMTTGANSPAVNVMNVNVPVPEMSALLPILSVCTAGVLAMLPGLLRRRVGT